ncbi:unnamed protein product [Closterium sp. NIES-53]
MDVARTSMIHAAAPHFLWPFAVQYTAHQINLQPRVSLPETTPTLRWTGKVGDASAFRVWGSRAFVRDTTADKLSSRAIPCVFLGFPPDTPGWQFYHPTSRRVLSSQDVTFDESVSYYCPASSGVSQVDPAEPVEVAIDSGAARGAEPAGAGTGGAETGGAELGGAEPERVEPGGAELGGTASWGTEPAAAGAGAAGGAAGAGAAGGAAGAGAAGGAAGAGAAGAVGPGGARTRGTGAAGAGGAAGFGAAGTGAAGPGGAGGAAGAGAAGGGAGVGAGGAGAGGSAASAGAAGGAAGAGAGGAAGAVTRDPGAEGTCAVSAISGGAAQPRPYYVPLLQQVLGPTPPLLSPPPVQSQSQFQPSSPLPGPSPYSGPTRGLTERREPESRPVSPESPPASPKSLSESPRVPRPSPPASSLPDGQDPESDSLRAASLTVTRFLATAVTDPLFESTAASALVAELVDGGARVSNNYGTKQRGVLKVDVGVDRSQAQVQQSAAAASSLHANIDGRRHSPLQSNGGLSTTTYVTSGGIAPTYGYFKFSPDRITVAPLQGRRDLITWRESIEPQLEVAGLKGFADGTVPTPPVDDVGLRGEFRAAHLLTFMVISRCCSPVVQLALRSCRERLDAGHQAWHFILSTYQVRDDLYIAQVEEKMTHIRMGEQESATDYCNRARRILSEMRMAGAEYSTASYISHIVKGLPRRYNLMKRMMMVPGTRETLDEDSITSYILQDEAMQEAEQPTELLPQANYAAPTKLNQQQGQRRIHGGGGSGGGRSMKDVDEKRSTRGKGRGGDGRRRECWICHDPDHLSYECPDRDDSVEDDTKGGRGRSTSSRPR